MNNIPLEINQLLRGKRKARALWQRTHFPTDKIRYNQLTNKLKTKLKEMREESLTESSPSVRTTTSTTGPWARSNKETSERFALHSANIFTPHNDERDQEIGKT
jgi:hypothetical protein